MEFITTGNRIAVENFSIGKIYTIVWATGNYKSLACVGKGSDFVMFQDQAPDLLFCLTMDTAIAVESIDEGGGGAGTMNYNELENKPSINGFVLVGNKTAADLGLATQSDLEDYATNASVVAGLATKQDALSSSQLQAVNSGITSALVTQIGTNTSAIAGKQDALSSSQLQAVNSGIDSTKVAQIETNKNNISKNAAELVDLVDSGAKSLIDFSSINPIAIRSSYTTITDGYTITGNASAAYPYMALPFTNFKAGNYVLKITVSAFTGADAAIYVKKGNYSIGTIIASQMVTRTGDISIPFTLDTDSAEMGITIYPNQAATEAQQSISVSKLMICTQAAWDVSQKYVPYRPTYEETVAQIATNEANILYNSVTGVKNVLKNDITTVTLGGVTGTTNSDGSITLSSSGAISNTFVLAEVSTIPVNGYNGISKNTTYKLKATGSDMVGVQVGDLDTESGTFNLITTATTTDETYTLTRNYVRFRIIIYSGADFTTPTTIYPLATLATHDTNYVPYAPSNAELYAMIKALQS